MTNEYIYEGEIINVVDGDTVDIRIVLEKAVDFGFHHTASINAGTRLERFRLYGIDAPERNKDYAGWKRSKEYLKSQIDGAFVRVESLKNPDAFGRYLCIIYKDGIDINNQMIQQGYAVHYVR